MKIQGLPSATIKLILLFSFVLAFNVLGSGKIFVNQQGYLSGNSKFVFCKQVADSFYVIRESDQQIVFREQLQLRINNDPATNFNIYTGDFSSVEQAGRFIIEIPSVGSSFSFSISDTVYNEVFRKSLKGFYFQRCGTALNSQHAGNYYHPACHLLDGWLHSSSAGSGFKLANGGWHDAGDYGKYIVNAGITAGTLLMAYEYFPDQFASDQIGIPESGNSIPDILDEVRYELEWFLKMQNSNSGGVYFKLTRENFSGMVMPQNDGETRYIYELSSTATADFAAVCARASRVFREFDSGFADQCKAAAENAWAFLVNNPDIVPAGGFHNPSGTSTGQYGDGSDLDERLWAAAELFDATGVLAYKNYFENQYNQISLFGSDMYWGNVGPLAHMTYLLSTQDSANPVTQAALGNALKNRCDIYVSEAAVSGFSVLLKPGEYNWGSNSAPLNKAILLLVANLREANPDYYNTALNQLNYVLGVNGHAISFVTGIGDSSVMNPHHRPSEADGITEPVPGLLAGGPNQYLSDPLLQSLFNSNTPPALCYIDDVDSYASNEIAINWNAPLVFVAGYFNGSTSTPVRNSQGTIIPENIRLFQNFPNPFNDQTRIRFHLGLSTEVSISIFDTNFRKVNSRNMGTLPAGEHNYYWNGKDHTGHALASGTYFYFLESKEHRLANKMLLIK